MLTNFSHVHFVHSRNLFSAFMTSTPQHFGHLDHVTHGFASLVMQQVVDLLTELCQDANSRLIGGSKMMTVTDPNNSKCEYRAVLPAVEVCSQRA